MGSRAKRLLWLAVRLLVVAALMAYVISRAPLDEVRSIALRLAERWPWVLAAFGVMLAQVPVAGIRWRRLLRVQDIHITHGESLRLTYIGWFFNNWMPGATGGDFVKAWYLASRTHRKPEAVTVVFLDRLVGLVALCVLGGVAVLVSLGDPRLLVPQVIIAAFLGCVAAGGVVFFSRRLRQFVRLDRLLERLPPGRALRKVDRAVFAYRYHKGTVALAVLYSWGAQAVSVLAIWFLAVGLGSRADWYHYFVNMPVVWIGWSLIPVPGGFGVAETLMQSLFTGAVLGGDGPALGAGEAAALALAMILAFRVVQMVVTLPGGLLYLARRTEVSPTHMREALEGEGSGAAAPGQGPAALERSPAPPGRSPAAAKEDGDPDA